MRALVLVLVSCSATPSPAPITGAEPVGTLTKVTSNYCPMMSVVGVWGSELFPGCPPVQFLSALPLCAHGTCGTPCATDEGGFGGPMGRESFEHVTTSSYDARGRFVAQTHDGAPWASCTYDGDRLSSCTLGERVLRAVRDASGRITAIADGDEVNQLRYEDGRLVAAGDVELTYDARGWVTKDGDEETEHDEDGRVRRTTKGTKQTTYSYEGDRLVRVVGPEYFNATFGYDDQGRIQRISRGGLETSSATIFRYTCE